MIADQVDQAAFAELFADTMLDMIFRDGFYHADPHPGNVFVLPEQRLGLLDCGKIGRVDEQTQDDFISIVSAFINRDAEGLTDELIQMCEVPADLNRSAYQADVAEFLAEFGDTSIGALNLGAAFESMFGIIRKYHLIVPPRVNMLLLVVVQTEGTAKGIDPDFNLTAALKGYGADLLQRRYSPRNLLREVMRSYRDWSRLLKAVPRETVSLLERAQKGELQIHVQQHGIQAPAQSTGLQRADCGPVSGLVVAVGVICPTHAVRCFGFWRSGCSACPGHGTPCFVADLAFWIAL